MQNHSSIKRFFLLDPLQTPRVAIALNWMIAICLIAPLFFLLFHAQSYSWHTIWEFKKLFIKGWLMTVSLSLLSFAISTFVAVLCAMAKHSRILLLRNIGSIYVEIIRGTPLLVQLLFFFYVIASALHLENRYLVGCIILSLFSGAYIAEILRAGIESISTSQIQSAQSLGFSKRQIYRYVIFPQAFRRILPPLAGQFASLIKDSSLLSILGINEFTYSAQQVNSATYSTLESFFPLAVGYLILTLPISLWSKLLEKRYLYET